ncbi:MAG: hypothetical protein KatS3mg115_1453 [Candidatus Poribacteria bacterium]|nr:MAG: hypothetical protein KatS3mg115_1453 [Candidatus Poribacteria bacterium]
MFTAWYKLDAAEDWTHISETQEALNDPIRVGLYAGIDAAAGQMTADYEYFEDLLVPFAVSPEGRLPVFWGRLKTSRSKLGP